MTNEEMLSVAEIVERATNRFNEQAAKYDKLIADMNADHEAKMVEHRAAFGARTKADAETIDRLHTERDALRAEVAALQERLRASIARGDFAQMEVVDLKAQLEKLKSQSKAPKYKVGDKLESYNRSLGLAIPVTVVGVRTVYDCQADGAEYLVGHSEAELKERYSQTPKHPVKVGEYVKRLTGFNTTLAGEIGKVTRVDDDDAEIEYEVKRQNGKTGVWCAKNCEPCAPPTEATHAMPAGKKAAEAVRDDRKIAPKPGDTVRLVRIPSRDDVSSELKTELEWPWIERWGTLNQTALVVEPAYQLDGALSVCLSTNVYVRWPISCIEVITVAEEIKVGDLVEVVSNRGRNTWFADVGSFGTVTSVEEINESISVHLDDVPGKKNALAGYVSLCDVRKVTT